MNKTKSHALAACVGIFLCLAGQYFYRLGSAQRPDERPGRIDLSIENGRVYRVRRVVDGDTIVLDSGLHVRLAGINTPEVGHYVRDPAPWADQARKKCSGILLGKDVKLNLAKEPLDAYGRVIAHVQVQSENGKEVGVGDLLLAEGLAKTLNLGLEAETYRRLKQIQDKARQEKKGLWGRSEFSIDRDALRFPYWAASTSELFHHADCSGLRRIQPGNLAAYESLEEAVTTGRRLCSRCLKRTVAEKRADAKPE